MMHELTNLERMLGGGDTVQAPTAPTHVCPKCVERRERLRVMGSGYILGQLIDGRCDRCGFELARDEALPDNPRLDG